MDTINAPATDIMTQVTELLTLFLDLFAVDSIGGDDADDVVAQGLAQYMGQVESIATVAESNGDMGLYHVCVHYQQRLEPLAGSTDLSEEVRLALEEWPTLIMMYLDMPTDADTCHALVEHLQNEVWPTPLAFEDAEALLHALVPPTEMVLTLAPTAETTEPLRTSLAEPQTTDLGADEEDAARPQALRVLVDAAPAAVVTAALLDLVPAAHMPEELTTSEALEPVEMYEPVAALTPDEPAYAEAVPTAVVAEPPLDLVPAADVPEEFTTTEALEPVEALEPSEILAPYALTALRSVDTVEFRREPFQTSPDVGPDVAALESDTAGEMADELELVSAMDDDWAEEEALPDRQREAQLADISLSLPEDVVPELLDTLLLKLPQQAAEFSAAIQRLAAGAGTLADVTVAQRIAHSLKGAANTVGVSGVANLTHHLEDILLAFYVVLTLAPTAETTEPLRTSLAEPQTTDLGADEEDAARPQALLVLVETALAAVVAAALLDLVPAAHVPEERTTSEALEPVEMYEPVTALTPDEPAYAEAVPTAVVAETPLDLVLAADVPEEFTTTETLAPVEALESSQTLEPREIQASYTPTAFRSVDTVKFRREPLETSPDVGQDVAALESDIDGEMTDELEFVSAMDDDWAEAEALDATAQNLLDLLCQEATQLAESLEETLTDAAVATDDWRQVLLDHSEELARFGEGAVAMGLEGLQQVSTYLCANLMQFITQEEPLSTAQRQVIQGWPTPVLHYLRGLHHPATHTALIAYLDDARWPEPLTDDDRSALQATLPHAELAIEDDEPLPDRQREAQLADISLSLPEDVVPELLDTLLQELPQQAAEFSAAIQRLAAGEGTLADVTVAQRIAHSLKGAANTVGVPGVANLTHHLEDILLAFSQHNTLPTLPLRRTLTNAADCLEAMSEALSGAGVPPPLEETLGTLQDVLDWANLIDEEGVPSDDTTQPPEREGLLGLAEDALDESVEAVAGPARTATAAPGARLGTDLVDGLLRLSGENLLLNGQLQDRLKRTTEQTRAIRAQNTTVQQLVWELEQLVDIRGVSSPLLQRTADGEFDPLEMEQYNELHTVSRRLLEAVTDALAVGTEVEGSLTSLDGLMNDQLRVQRESEATIMQTRMVAVKTIAPRLQRGVRQACRLTGKEAEFALSGGDTLLDSHVLNGMLDPLMHMLRNAVDHGIEAPEDREAQGKARTGTIALDFTREGNTVIVRCRDDGAGLDYDAIRRTALARGLIEAEVVLPEDELGRLILHPGFSTRTQTTQVSGRGIGMDVVYTRIQELKGSLRLASDTGKGCLMEVRLPVSLMSTHGLLVRSGTQVFAVSDLGIEQILYPAAGVLRQEGQTMTYQWGNEALEATTLEALLNLPVAGTVEELSARPALLIRDAVGRRQVVVVHAVLDSLALVVKPLGRYVPTIQGVAGATILGNGTVTAVLDLPDLFRVASHVQTTAGALQETVRLAERALPVALVVDDSLSARRALADFVQDLGFEVHTAGDGLEAIASMERHMPDILLVDLEMPRMNGLELAEHVRVRHTADALPIIMVTSRSTEKHRRTAARSGVNVYLVKPFPEDTLAEHIQHLTEAKAIAAGAA